MRKSRSLRGRLLSAASLVPVAALALGGVIVGAGAAQQRGDFGTAAVRNGFVNTNRIDIVDGRNAEPYPSKITVKDLPDRLYDVNVVLHNFEHTNPDDVDILVVGPNGRTAIVMADAGGTSSVSGIDITLDDEAPNGAVLPDSGRLTAGTFRPRNYSGRDSFRGVDENTNTLLGTFDRINPNGVWELYVVDDSRNGKAGKIAGGWKLEILYGEAPIAVDDEYTARMDRRLVVSQRDGVLANDNDGDPEPGVEASLSARLRSGPRQGTVRLRSDGSFVYKPNGRADGTDSFTYYVRDQDGLRDTGEVTIFLRRP